MMCLVQLEAEAEVEAGVQVHEDSGRQPKLSLPHVKSGDARASITSAGKIKSVIILGWAFAQSPYCHMHWPKAAQIVCSPNNRPTLFTCPPPKKKKFLKCIATPDFPNQ
jgi:hypothetical protein